MCACKPGNTCTYHKYSLWPQERKDRWNGQRRLAYASKKKSGVVGSFGQAVASEASTAMTVETVAPASPVAASLSRDDLAKKYNSYLLQNMTSIQYGLEDKDPIRTVEAIFEISGPLGIDQDEVVSNLSKSPFKYEDYFYDEVDKTIDVADGVEPDVESLKKEFNKEIDDLSEAVLIADNDSEYNSSLKKLAEKLEMRPMALDRAASEGSSDFEDVVWNRYDEIIGDKFDGEVKAYENRKAALASEPITYYEGKPVAPFTKEEAISYERRAQYMEAKAINGLEKYEKAQKAYDRPAMAAAEAEVLEALRLKKSDLHGDTIIEVRPALSTCLDKAKKSLKSELWSKGGISSREYAPILKDLIETNKDSFERNRKNNKMFEAVNNIYDIADMLDVPRKELSDLYRNDKKSVDKFIETKINEKINKEFKRFG